MVLCNAPSEAVLGVLPSACRADFRLLTSGLQNLGTLGALISSLPSLPPVSADLINLSGLLPLSRMLQARSEHADEGAAADEAPRPSMPRVSSVASIATQDAGNSPPASGRSSPCGGISTAAAAPAPSTSLAARMQSDLARMVAAAAAEVPGSAAASLPRFLSTSRASLMRDPLSRCGTPVSSAQQWEYGRPSMPLVGEKRSHGCSPASLSTKVGLDDSSNSTHESMALTRPASRALPTASELTVSVPLSSPCTTPILKGQEPSSPQAITILQDGAPGAMLPRIANLSQGCADGMLLLSATACLVARSSHEANDAPSSAKRLRAS